MIFNPDNPLHMETMNMLLDLLCGRRVVQGDTARYIDRVEPDEVAGSRRGRRVSRFDLECQGSACPSLAVFEQGVAVPITPDAWDRLYLGFSGERKPDHVHFFLKTPDRGFVFLARTMNLIEHAVRVLSARPSVR